MLDHTRPYIHGPSVLLAIARATLPRLYHEAGSQMELHSLKWINVSNNYRSQYPIQTRGDAKKKCNYYPSRWELQTQETAYDAPSSRGEIKY